MRKALAQNPNLLRTLLGLSFTLIFMLSYAVYANTIDTAYYTSVSYTHLRAHETGAYLVCRLLLEKKKK